MKQKVNAVCYLRVAALDNVVEREQELRLFAKKRNYEISDFIIEQRSGLAPCSKTLSELLHSQSAINILVPTISGLSRNISVLQDIIYTAKKNNKNIISADGSCEAIRSFNDVFSFDN